MDRCSAFADKPDIYQVSINHGRQEERGRDVRMTSSGDLKGRKRESSTWHGHGHSNLFGRRGKDTHRPRYYETLFRRVHALRVLFPRGLVAWRARGEDVRRAEGEVTREKEREKGKESRWGGGTHVRATTMYFGAALHTPRGGQCPSLLRLKEGAEGREGWRELGRRRKGALRGRERERGRVAGRRAQARSGKK